MNAIGLIAALLFGVGWLGGVIAWLYCVYHLIASKFQIDDPHMREFFKGAAAFIGCWLFAFSNGLIGLWLGDGKPSWPKVKRGQPEFQKGPVRMKRGQYRSFALAKFKLGHYRRPSVSSLETHRLLDSLDGFSPLYS